METWERQRGAGDTVALGDATGSYGQFTVCCSSKCNSFVATATTTTTQFKLIEQFPSLTIFGATFVDCGQRRKSNGTKNNKHKCWPLKKSALLKPNRKIEQRCCCCSCCCLLCERCAGKAQWTQFPRLFNRFQLVFFFVFCFLLQSINRATTGNATTRSLFVVFGCLNLVLFIYFSLFLGRKQIAI